MEKESILEAEIAELSQAIEIKRTALAAERGVVTEREIVQQTVKHYAESIEPAVSPLPAAAKNDDYFNALDPESLERVNGLIANLAERGIKKTLIQAREEIPYILDAFHDVLVTRLYEELKNRGIVH